MKKGRAWGGILPLAVLWVACSGGSGSTLGPRDVDAGKDQLPEDVHITNQDGGVDLLMPDFRGKDVPEVKVDGEGELDASGEVWNPQPCQSHEDCADGYCVELVPGSGEYFCTPSCMEECPLDWACKSVFIDGPDAVSICLPPGDTLCKVCQDNGDCLLAGSLCITGSGLLGFCGRACNWQNDDCPPGFECVLHDDGEGNPLGYQCTPGPGSCCAGNQLASCDDDNTCTFDGCDASLGCTHEAADNECSGDNPCMEYFCQDGECLAVPIVADDTLNHIDDDCDGLTDEEAYKEFRLVTGQFSAAAGKSEGGDQWLWGVLGGSSFAGVSSDESLSIESGILHVLALLGME